MHLICCGHRFVVGETSNVAPSGTSPGSRKRCAGNAIFCKISAVNILFRQHAVGASVLGCLGGLALRRGEAAAGRRDQPLGARTFRRLKKYRAHLVEVRSLFAITSPSVHSVQRFENINNLYPVVTSRRESERANAHRDWSHLALRKPATSRPVDGRYGGHRQQCYAWQENNYSDTTSRFRNNSHNSSPRIFAPGLEGRNGQLSRRHRRRGTGR